MTAGFSGNANNLIVPTLHEYQGYLYASVENETDGAELWRSSDGLNWSQVLSHGGNHPDNTKFSSLITFQGAQFMGTHNSTTGAQFLRSADGIHWAPLMSNGFGDVNNVKIESLYVFQESIFAVTMNDSTGLEVWRTADGLDWHQVGQDGLGDSNNSATLWNTATTEFNGSLYLGTSNWANGGEVWKYLHNRTYLPVLIAQ